MQRSRVHRSNPDSDFIPRITPRQGIKIDSSIYPIVHDRYGIPESERGIYDITTANGAITEFPLSVFRIANHNIPVAGGGYLRLYPLMITLGAIRSLNKSEQPFMLYFHPWEIDPEQPRLRVGSIGSRFRHYVNLNRTEQHLDRLLSRFEFGKVTESLASYLPTAAKLPATSIANVCDVPAQADAYDVAGEFRSTK